MPHKDPEAAKAYKRAYYRDYRKGIRRTNRSDIPDEEIVRRYKERAEKEKARKRKYGPRESSEQKLIREAKSKPCIDCGVELPHQVMHLDHVRGKKKFKLSGRSQAGLPKNPQKRRQVIIEELAKCDTRCPNCHRMRHYYLDEIGNPNKRDSQEDPDAPNPLKPTQDVWQARAKALGLEFLEEIDLSTDRVKIRCLECSYEWKIKPLYVTTGKAACRECSLKKRRIPQEEWDQRAKEVNVVWLEPVKNIREDTKARCLRCSKEFLARPAGIANGNGCWDCGQKDRAQKAFLPQEVWDERIAKVGARWISPVEHGDKKAPAECLECGYVWDAWPSRIQKGHGCKECKRRNKVWVPKGIAAQVFEIIKRNPGVSFSGIAAQMKPERSKGSLSYALKRLRNEGLVERQDKAYTAK